MKQPKTVAEHIYVIMSRTSNLAEKLMAAGPRNLDESDVVPFKSDNKSETAMTSCDVVLYLALAYHEKAPSMHKLR